jgi:ABC-type nitrate/sulfonate/bicarbonate transport system permease component
MTVVADAPPARSAPRKAPKRGNPVTRALKKPVTGRLTFPLVCLAVWLLSLEVVESIWPFAVDVLPHPYTADASPSVLEFMWAEIITDTVAPLNLYEAFGLSLQRLGIGLAIAMVLGTIIGLAMGLSSAVNAFLNDWIVAILAMPNLAWALFCSLAFGFGHTGPIICVVLTGIPFVIINVREGVRNAPSDLFDMARAFGVSRGHVIRHVLLPSLLPFLFAAGRYAFALGWKGLVVAEVFGGQDGAGWTIKFWYDAHRAHGVVGYALFFVIFAILFEKFLFDRLAAHLFRWRPALDSGDVVEEEFDAAAAPALTGVAAETRAITRQAFDEPDPFESGTTTPDAAPRPTSRRHNNG